MRGLVLPACPAMTLLSGRVLPARPAQQFPIHDIAISRLYSGWKWCAMSRTYPVIHLRKFRKLGKALRGIHA